MMKILSFADVHAQKSSLKIIAEKARHADLMICAGDLSIFGHGLEQSLQALNKADKPILIIPGNHETEEDIRHLSQRFQHVISIHKRAYQVGDYIFVGFGGGGFSLREPEMEAFFKKIAHKLPQGKKLIFVTHAPPYNTVLDYLPWLKEHRGCKTTVDIIKMIKPHLVVCGHFHETASKNCMIGKTFAINPGCNGKIVSL